MAFDTAQREDTSFLQRYILKENKQQKEQVGSPHCPPADGEGRPTVLNLCGSASYPTHWKVVAFHFCLLNFVCAWASTYTCLRLQNICVVAFLPVWPTVTRAASCIWVALHEKNLVFLWNRVSVPHMPFWLIYRFTIYDSVFSKSWKTLKHACSWHHVTTFTSEGKILKTVFRLWILSLFVWGPSTTLQRADWTFICVYYLSILPSIPLLPQGEGRVTLWQVAGSLRGHIKTNNYSCSYSHQWAIWSFQMTWKACFWTAGEGWRT